MEIVENRFLRYVAIDTQSDPDVKRRPSTSGQMALLEVLRDELIALGAAHVTLHSTYLTAEIPATVPDVPTVGFIAHVDTSPDMSGEYIKPKFWSYKGGDIEIGNGYILSQSQFPELGSLIGHRLITTDGTTLLGADDKAGVAEIMCAAEYLLKTADLQHGKVCIAFTCDEEIGAGVDDFDVEAFGAKYAYTIDGGELGELEFENFNAASAVVMIKGVGIHPGSAKGKMLNASLLAMEFASQLPEDERPENTENYEGFFHLTDFLGDVEKAMLNYIIRDHDKDNFERRKSLITKIADEMNDVYGESTVYLTIKDQYYNMRDRIAEHPEVVDIAKQAMIELGIAPIIRPIRGGTDGARLSYMGLPCPNLFTGGANFHGRYEYVSIDTMNYAVQTILKIVNNMVNHS